MKWTRSWLSDHLDTQVSDAGLIDALVSLGTETTGKALEAYGPSLVLGYIKSCEAHPQADRLKVCQVETGPEEVRQIVCGAPNAAPGWAIVALPGTLLPGSTTPLKACKLRGIESQGMLCSAEELGWPGSLMGFDTGIVLLPHEEDFFAGKTIDSLLGLPDFLFDAEITPNRGDLWSIRGIARDLTAKNTGCLRSEAPFLSPACGINLPESHLSSVSDLWRSCQEVPLMPIAIQTTKCSRYAAIQISGAHNRISPLGLRWKLGICGIKSVSLVVDILNAISHASGQPLHIMDTSSFCGPYTLEESQTQSFKSLQGSMLNLPQGSLIFRNEEKIGVLSGIVGSQDTACQLSTTDYMIEAALFDREAISRTGRALKLHTEARTRFERGIDPEGPLPVLCEAITVLRQLTGGTIKAAFYQPGCLENPAMISFPWTQFEKRTGIDLDVHSAVSILEGLGFQIIEKPSCLTGTSEKLVVQAPAFRQDITLAEDVIEEVLRIKGYDHLPMLPLPPVHASDQSYPDRLYHQEKKARLFLASLGFQEGMTWSFCHEKQTAFYGAEMPFALHNPLSRDWTVLRPSGLVHMPDLLWEQQKRGQDILGLFEIGPTWNSLGAQDDRISGMVSLEQTVFWNAKPALDLWDLKGLVLGLLSLFGVSEKDLSWRQENLFPNLHPTCQAAFLLKEEPVAWWGEWNTACDPVGLRGKWGAFEVRSDFLSRMSRPASERTAPKISPFPQIRRDFSFWVPQKLPLTTVFEDLKETAGSFCIAIKLFDRFCNQEGVNSCAVRLIFQSDEKTLTDQDLDLSLSAFLQKAQDYGLKLRDQ